uniref:Insulin-like growth factor-binding protein 5 n=1 Tax=Neogobius melanostomus TaxID=47308 RepID=A0A8C6SNB6_9GOBI
MLLCACVLSLLVAACRASYVPCKPCDQKERSLCPPVPVGCQLVKEPGCGCCLTCALEEGHSCGVYTEPCTRGLRCLPKNGEEKPCTLISPDCLSPADSLDARMPGPETVPSVAKVPLYGLDHISSRKAQAMKQAQKRKQQLARVGQVSHVDFPAHGISKSDPEFGPCRRRLDNLIQSMKDTSRVFALSLYLPNCDKKGFFKRKQCKPSRGRKRGICWCVDKFGVKIPGINYAGGNLQCKDWDNASNNE